MQKLDLLETKMRELEDKELKRQAVEEYKRGLKHLCAEILRFVIMSIPAVLSVIALWRTF